MARLEVIAGEKAGQAFELLPGRTLIGRDHNAAIQFAPIAISREHATITHRDGDYYLEDLHSLNKTYLNQQEVVPGKPVKLSDKDRIQVGPVVMLFTAEKGAAPAELPMRVTDTISVKMCNPALCASNPARKLHVVLEIARHLATTLDLDRLLDRLLGLLFDLFPQADRGLALLLAGDAQAGKAPPDLMFRVQAQRFRRPGAARACPYSRSLVWRALESGEGLLSENVPHDPNVPITGSMAALDLRSFLCVPLLGSDGQRLGVVQLDALYGGAAFTHSDLDLLAAIALQVSTVVEKAAMHAELVRRARTEQELQAAGEVQMSLLPRQFGALEEGRGVELFARLLPARCVAGDLYDAFPLADGRLALLVGDVSGKGMPAALYMIAVRTLTRQLADEATSPADLIVRLHRALLADAATEQFVTLLYGAYSSAEHAVTFALAGHPPPLLRRADGTVLPLLVKATPMAGTSVLAPSPVDTTVALAPGDTFIAYTDGCCDQYAPGDGEHFGLARLMEALSGPRTGQPLRQCVDEAAADIRQFAGTPEQQDDRTLLLLRRKQGE